MSDSDVELNFLLKIMLYIGQGFSFLYKQIYSLPERMTGVVEETIEME